MELAPILSSKFVAFLVSGTRSVFKTTIEFQIVERQHAMMKTNTQNYANVITNIPRKYRLPELYNILQDIPTNWKQEIKDKIQEYWEKQWIEEAKKRTSLKFLAIPKMSLTILLYIFRFILSR
jgi:hypothetical protein